MGLSYNSLTPRFLAFAAYQNMDAHKQTFVDGGEIKRKKWALLKTYLNGKHTLLVWMGKDLADWPDWQIGYRQNYENVEASLLYF